MTKEELAAQEQREADLKAREEAVAFAEQKQVNEANTRFVETQIESGKMVPADREGAIAFMAALSADDTVEFGEGSDKKTTNPTEWFMDFVSRLPKQVNFSELGGAGQGGDEIKATYKGPQGIEVNSDKLDLHQQILSYSEEKGVDYATAAIAVTKE